MADRPDVAQIIHGDCRTALAGIATASIDSVVTDPPYAEVDRSYGRLSEPDWESLMWAVIPEIRRVLKPSGSALFILQGNSERVGKMRAWLYRFKLRVCEEWGIVQDAYWFNPQAMPTIHCKAMYGLMRPSVKDCVWAGTEDCYRNQGAVMAEPAESTKKDKRVTDTSLKYSDSSHHVRHSNSIGTCLEKGATPFNLQVFGRGGGNGHGAATPLELCKWWVRYLTPPDGVVLDPFAGSGTTLVAAVEQGFRSVGIEQDAAFVATTKRRVANAILAKSGPTPTAGLFDEVL